MSYRLKPSISPVEPTVFSLQKLIGYSKAEPFNQEELQLAKTKAINFLFKETTQLRKSSSGQPFLTLSNGGTSALSISHNKLFLALISAPPSFSLGVDIESYRESISNLAPRFLSEEECHLVQLRIQNDPRNSSSLEKIYCTQLWCAKEAAYKVLSSKHPEVDFRRYYKVACFSDHHALLHYLGENPISLVIHFFLHSSYCLAYTQISREKIS